MKFLVLLFASLVMLVSSVSGFSTYVSTSGSTLSITTTYGSPHWYSGINLAPGAYLAGVDLFDTNLTDADLSNANLSGADLSYAYLRGANLSGADLTGVFLLEGYWTDANLYGAILPDGYDQDWFEEAGAIFVETVPEPSTYALLLSGAVLGYAFLRRRK